MANAGPGRLLDGRNHPMTQNCILKSGREVCTFPNILRYQRVIVPYVDRRLRQAVQLVPKIMCGDNGVCQSVVHRFCDLHLHTKSGRVTPIAGHEYVALRPVYFPHEVVGFQRTPAIMYRCYCPTLQYTIDGHLIEGCHRHAFPASR